MSVEELEEAGEAYRRRSRRPRSRRPRARRRRRPRRASRSGGRRARRSRPPRGRVGHAADGEAVRRAPRARAPIARSASTTRLDRGRSPSARSSSAPLTALVAVRARRRAARTSGSSSTSSGTSSARDRRRDRARPSAPRRRRPARPPSRRAVEDPDARAHPLEHVEQPGAARVEADVVDRQPRARAAAPRRRGTARPTRSRPARAPRASRSRSGGLDADATPAAPVTRTPAACEHQLGVVARRRRLDDRRRPARAEPGEQDRRLHLRARDRQLVVDRLRAARPRSRAAACRRSSSICAPICASGSAIALHRPARERLVADELERAVLEGEQARDQPRERAGVAAVDRRAGARRPRRPTPCTTSVSTSVLVDLRRRARATAASVDSVSPERPKPRIARLAVGRARRAAARGARSTCRPARAMWPSSAARRLNLHRAPPRRRRRSPGSRAASAARRASPSPVTSSVSVPPRSGETCCELEVLDVDPLRAERLRDPREHARPVGDVDAHALQLARVGVRALEHPAAVAAPPRRSSARGSPRRRCSSAASTCSIRRRCSASSLADARRRCRGRCRPRCAGSRRRCASCRAASRRRSRAARGPRRAPRRPGSTTTFASTCGTWLVSATRRSCASGSIATGRRAEVGDEAVHEPVALRGRSGVTGVRNHVAPSKRRGARVLGAARLGAADRVAADEARRAGGRLRRRSPSSSRRR